MQLTAPRCVPPLRVATTFNLKPRALPGAVADLVSLGLMRVSSSGRKVSHTVALFCELVGVVILFFWAWPQPLFFTDDLLSTGRSEHADEIASQKRSHSARAMTGLALLVAGCCIQVALVWAETLPKDSSGADQLSKT